MTDAVATQGGISSERAPSRTNWMSLEDRARRAHGAATAHLLEQRHSSAAWRQDLDLCALNGAFYVLFLHLTGLIEDREAAADEAKVVRHMINQVNPDGGFYKYPGSPSSRGVSNLSLLALQIALGSVEGHTQHSGWFTANESIDNKLRLRIERCIDRARNAMRIRRSGSARRAFETDFRLTQNLLKGCIEPVSLFPRFHLEPEFVAWILRNRTATAIARHTSTLTRRMVPSHSILYRSAVRRSPVGKKFLATLGRLPAWRRLEARSLRELTSLIASWQNENGGWFYSPLYTMINAIALAESGVTGKSGVIHRAHRYVRSAMFSTADGGIGISIATPDVWDTSSAIISYLEQAGRRATDPEIRPSVEFLLASSGQNGGYAWGSRSSNDTDNDSTGYALRALAVAAKTGDRELERALLPAVSSAVRYLNDRQDCRGGFSVWDPCVFPVRPGSMSFGMQKCFDLATADTTARVLTGLGAAGLTWQHLPVRRAVHDVMRLQHRNGGWWCRWCAGYIPGTFFVLEALAGFGVRQSAPPDGSDSFMAEAYHAMGRGIGFLLAHQNKDGGWGESTRADINDRYAGIGGSRPLQTAFSLVALIGCEFPAGSEEIERGICWLLNARDPGGKWSDDQAIFTLFARTWYYRYPLYNFVMPLRALTVYLRAIDIGAENPDGCDGRVPRTYFHPC